MATPDETRLAALEAALAGQPMPLVEGVEELARAEQARAARHFGFAQPMFRTSVRMHFSGEGVRGHDLEGSTAGGVIAGFTGSVDAAGAQLNLPPQSTALFLSPSVLAGSTVLELFGAELANRDQETMDGSIVDTPVDRALERLFVVLDQVGQAEANAGANMPEIDGPLGRRLFALARDLIGGDLDLELTWTRPRGASKGASLRRSTARALRDHLNVETVETTRREDTGTLESVSTAGKLSLRPEGKKSSVSIDVPEADIEGLRMLWARRVDVAWTETTTSHPQRDDNKVQRELVSIREAAADDRPDELPLG